MRRPVTCKEHTDVALLGHMFNQHYLDPMFPLSRCEKQAAEEKRGIKWKSGGKSPNVSEDNAKDHFDELFLDRIVTPDERLAMRRDFTKIVELGIVRRESGLEFGSGQVLKAKDANGDGCLTLKRTTSDRIVAEEARGKTVRELSRLWKYFEGRSPIDHDHDEYRDHDEPHPRERRNNQHYQRKFNQESGNGAAFEPQKRSTSFAFDRPKSPVPDSSPTAEERSFHVSQFSRQT